MNEPRVASIHVGKIAPLGPEGVPSGFVKHRAPTEVTVTPLGILGDEQADLRVHGGPDKAVYAYASSHYDAWRLEYPQHTLSFASVMFTPSALHDCKYVSRDSPVLSSPYALMMC